MNSQIEPERALIGTDAQRRAGQRSSGLVLTRISAHRDPRTVTLEIGKQDIRVRRNSGILNNSRHCRGGKRKAITKFSRASARRLFFTARNLPNLEIMLTLTYPREFPMDGRAVKDHWRRFRQWMVRNNATSGLWVLEFQERGAPHFHVFLTEPLDRHAVSAAWFRIVGSGDPKHLAAGTRIETFRYPPALGGYVMKYAAKLQQKEVPPEYEAVGRFWGTWGSPDITRNVRLPLRSAKQLVRIIRRAHIKKRKDWQNPRRFRDNGRSGFIAWDTSSTVARLLTRVCPATT